MIYKPVRRHKNWQFILCYGNNSLMFRGKEFIIGYIKFHTYPYEGDLIQRKHHYGLALRVVFNPPWITYRSKIWTYRHVTREFRYPVKIYFRNMISVKAW
jgi:hypothetical protein